MQSGLCLSVENDVKQTTTLQLLIAFKGGLTGEGRFVQVH